MADKVESIIDRMIDELKFYKDESLFSGREITKIVKQRRADEYSMQRKDADVSHFLDAIKYERTLDLKRKSRVKKQQMANKKAGIQKKQTQFREENCIHRRLIQLYQRACRKFRGNKSVRLEFLHYLLQTKSTQQLNRAVADCLQLMPEELEFWLVAAYAELEVKGNMFAGRQLMLQGLRQNEMKTAFHLQYLKFEILTFEKVMKRRELLNQPQQAEEGQLDFVDSDVEADTKQCKSGTEGSNAAQIEEANLIRIVYQKIADQFQTDALVLRDAKRMLQGSKYLAGDPVVAKSKQLYQAVKETEQGQCSLISAADLGKADGEKIARMVRRALGSARQKLLCQLELAGRAHLGTALCDGDCDRLELIWKIVKNGTSDQTETVEALFRSVEDTSSLAYLVTKLTLLSKGNSPDAKQTNEQLQQLEKQSEVAPDPNDGFSTRCWIKAKDIIMSAMQTRPALLIAYYKKTIASHPTRFPLHAKLTAKFCQLLPAESSIKAIQAASVTDRLPAKVYDKLIRKASGEHEIQLAYEAKVKVYGWDAQVWLSYLEALTELGLGHLVRRTKERALVAATDKSQLMI